MKKLSALLLSALLLLGAFAAFTGCGGGNDNPPDTTTDKIDYNGTININLPIKDYPFEDIALKAVAEAYMDKHPETDVKVEGQTSSTYKDWLDSQFAGGSSVTDADIVQTLLISNAYLTTKMVDYSSYLVKPNPYNQNKSWKDTMEEEAYPLSTDRSGIYTLNFTTNMSFFFYNKTLWKQAGLTNADGTDKAPKTWDELLEFCAQIESNTQDKVPFAVGGATYTTGAMSWLLNIYGDQYYRGIADDHPRGCGRLLLRSRYRRGLDAGHYRQEQRFSLQLHGEYAPFLCGADGQPDHAQGRQVSGDDHQSQKTHSRVLSG